MFNWLRGFKRGGYVPNDIPPFRDRDAAMRVHADFMARPRTAGPMTLRDEFAMAALKDCLTLKPAEAAQRAYVVADAMMKAREQ